MPRVQIGIRDGMLRLPWHEALHAAREIGADAIELDVTTPDNSHPVYTPAGRDELHSVEIATDVRVVSICLGVLWNFPPSSANPEVRRSATKLIDETVRACDAAGIPFILAPLVDCKTEPPTSVEVQRAGWFEVLSTLRPLLATAKTSVCFELCGRDFMHSVDDARELFEKADVPDSVGVYYDTANGFKRGHRPRHDIPELARQRRLKIVHLKDTNNKDLGEGEVDFASVKSELRAAGYRGPLVLETPGGNDPLESARKNVDFARKFFES